MNAYQLIKPILFRMDAEKAHHLTIRWLNRLYHFSPALLAYIANAGEVLSGSESAKVFGLDFPNRVGLAAGMDKNAEAVDAWAALGFGFVEIGTVTPRPQPGNDKPRLFRLPADLALVNRMGFNNQGVDLIAHRLSKRKSAVVVGGNIGKNKDTPNDQAVDDYLICFKKLHDVVDYFVVNVSSPNTPGLRALQDKEFLQQILGRLQQENSRFNVRRPILLKIAPDLTDGQLEDIVALAETRLMDGLIANNTTISREGLKTSPNLIQAIGSGGLSGEPLAERSTAVLCFLRKSLPAAFPIISSGGIMSAETAKRRNDAGADLIQLYTGLVYQGPALIHAVRQALTSGLGQNPT